MPKIKYKEQNFKPASLRLIAKCNVILNDFAGRGYDMTLRQLYYQLVAAAEIENTPRSYENLGGIVNDARLAGLIDWYHLVDRTRSLKALSHWEEPQQIITAVANQYRIDKWKDQPIRPEVWIEKEALAGVFARVCDSLDVAYFSCRGYNSQSEMWRAAQRMLENEDAGQATVILHFGDHDPSGIDMTRDINDRLEMFMGGVEVQRLALNMDQVEEYNPPPNPAKVTDSRAAVYIQTYGNESWELDALDPDTLAELVRREVDKLMDHDLWGQAVELEQQQRQVLSQISENFQAVSKFVGEVSR